MNKPAPPRPANIPDDWIELNRRSWNRRTPVHVDSGFYDHAAFLKRVADGGRGSLPSIDVEVVGDVTGADLLHLQCHFGQDTLSWAARGARATGLDFSDVAIEAAREASQATGIDATFRCADVYSHQPDFERAFDVVYTSYGTIGWLPDLDRWAATVANYLRPGGQFHLLEFHPVIWMFDDKLDRVAYSYFNVDSIRETQSGTYADPEAPIEVEDVGWNHPIGEVQTALLQAGLAIEAFREFDYSSYPIFADSHEVQPGRWVSKRHQHRLPYVYHLKATRIA